MKLARNMDRGRHVQVCLYSFCCMFRNIITVLHSNCLICWGTLHLFCITGVEVYIHNHFGHRFQFPHFHEMLIFSLFNNSILQTACGISHATLIGISGWLVTLSIFSCLSYFLGGNNYSRSLQIANYVACFLVNEIH